MARPADFADRAAAIVAGGLPCRIACARDGDFSRLDLHPLPGWVHLASDDVVDKHLADGDCYHVSLSTWPVDEGIWNRIVERWHGVETVIRVQYVNGNGGAVLAWEGLGADPDLWLLYTSGSYGYKWVDNNYGLHISM